VTNEKRLLERAGLRGIDVVMEQLGADPQTLARTIADAETLFASVSTSAATAT
jgi:hypothetical protein